MPDVDVEVNTLMLSEFAEDIIDHIRPLLEVVGLVSGTSDEIDFNGFSFEKLAQLFHSYERTTALLSLLDLMEPTIQSVTMHKDQNGFIREGPMDPGTDGNESTWYRLTTVPIDESKIVDVCLSVTRDITRDGNGELVQLGGDSSDHAQTMLLGFGLSLSNVAVGDVDLDLLVDVPLLCLRAESGAFHSQLVLKSANTNDDHLATWVNNLYDSAADPEVINKAMHAIAAISISASIYKEDGARLQAELGTAAMSCKSVQLDASFSNYGDNKKFDLALTEPEGSIGEFGLSLQGLEGGMNFDWNNILTIFGDSVGNEILRDHLLPAFGLIQTRLVGWELPPFPFLSVAMNLGDFDNVIGEIRGWFLSMFDDDLIPVWLGHLGQFFSGLSGGGSFDNPFSNGDGNPGSPWQINLFDLGDLSVNLEAWTTSDESDGYSINFGLDATFSRSLNQMPFDLSLNTHWLRLNLSGGDFISVLPDLSLSLRFEPGSGSLISWDGLSLPSALQSFGLGSGDLSIGGFLAGIELNASRQPLPFLLLTDVTLPGASVSIDIDLLNTTIPSISLDQMLVSLRDSISDVLALHPLLQRLGALIGLVSPRGGSFRTDYWEHSSSDLRIGSSRPGWPTLLQLIENPMETIGHYHREILKMGVLNLDPGLPTPTEQAWTYLAEAIQDLIQAGILILRGTPVVELEASQPYAIRTEDSDLAVGVSFENEGPQDRHIVTLTPALIRAPLRVEFEYNHDNDHFSISPFIAVSEFPLGASMVADVEVALTLFECELPPQSPANGVWVSNAHAEIVLHHRLIDGDRPSLPILSYGPYCLSIDAFSGGLEWRREPAGKGYFYSIEGLNFVGAWPNLGLFFTDLIGNFGPGFDFSQLEGWSWDGNRLRLPDGSWLNFSGPNMGWFGRTDQTSGNELPDLEWGSIPWPINLADYLGLPNLPSLNLGGTNGDGSDFDFNFPDFEFHSMDSDLDFDFDSIFNGLFSGMSGAPGSWSLPNFLALPSIRSMIGQFLSLRGGRLGFFLAGFLRLDPSLPYLDLGRMTSRNGFVFPEFEMPDWPDAWRFFHGKSGDRIGLGPFSLPFDWPEFDLPAFLVDPLGTIKIHIGELFSGTSNSGEPFAFTALRWLQGLLSGSLPDLRLPDIGWGGNRQTQDRDGNWFDLDLDFNIDFDINLDHDILDDMEGQFQIKIPPLPVTIDGQGTYDDPWAIGLQPKGWPKMELILWLDPDGLPREHIQEVFQQVSDEVMSIVDVVVAGAFNVDTADFLPNEWTHSLATMISLLARLDDRASHAVGHMSVGQLHDLLVGFDAFLSTSDGLIPEVSQRDPYGLWANSNQTLSHHAHHLNVLSTESVADECSQFLSNLMQLNPGEEASVLFVTPSWLGNNACDLMATNMNQILGWPSANVEVVDFSDVVSVSTTSIMSTDIAGIPPSAFTMLIPSLNIASGGSMRDGLAIQVKRVVEHITAQRGGKVFLIGHSVGGLAMRYYTEGWADLANEPDEAGIHPPQPPEDYVLGAVSLSTPHDHTAVRLNPDGHHVQTFLHLLKLLGALQDYTFEETDPSTTVPFSEIPVTQARNASLALVEAISKLYSDSRIVKKNPEVNE